MHPIRGRNRKLPCRCCLVCRGKFGYDFHETPHFVGSHAGRGLRHQCRYFSASRNTNGSPRVVLKFTAAVKFWRRVFITDMFKKKHPKLVELVCKICQKADSQWEVLETLEATNAERRSAAKKGKSGQVVVLARAGEKLETHAKVMTFPEFQTSINKVDATRTVSSSEAARVR